MRICIAPKGRILLQLRAQIRNNFIYHNLSLTEPFSPSVAFLNGYILLRSSFSITIFKLHVRLDAVMLLLKTTSAAILLRLLMLRWYYTSTHLHVLPEQSNAASLTEVRFFCCCCRRRCMFLSCTHDVLIVGCDSFRSSFILDTRFSSPSSFFYCTFMFLWSSFIDALPVCVFADSCVSSGAPSFVVNTQALPVLPAHHIFFLILNHPRPSRQVRAWSAPEAVAYYEYKGRLYKNMLQCRTLPSYNI